MFFSESNIILFSILGFIALGVIIISRKKNEQNTLLPTTIIPINSTKFSTKISKPKLVNAILNWCIEHIGDKENQPIVQLSYHPHRKKYGCYLVDKKTIRIYIKNHKTIESLALTIIHEFVHFIELKSEKERNNYARFQHQHGYQSNPYECSANEIASKHYQQCLIDLSAKGYLDAELPLF